MQHYNADEYLQAVDRLEESLREALSALEECRALCEGPLEDEEVEEEEDLQPGLYEAIAGSVRGPKVWVRKPFFLQWTCLIFQRSCLAVRAAGFHASLSCSPLHSGVEVPTAVRP